MGELLQEMRDLVEEKKKADEKKRKDPRYSTAWKNIIEEIRREAKRGSTSFMAAYRKDFGENKYYHREWNHFIDIWRKIIFLLREEGFIVEESGLGDFGETDDEVFIVISWA